jgi:diadenosine tetraphosphate (Ap4A) HIT family hydrolase
MYHKRKTRKLYEERLPSDKCPFCEDKTVANSVKDTALSYVLPNITYYDVWEMQDVEEHLMIIPRRHVKSLHELTPEEKLDIMTIAGGYEVKGYNIYARAADSTTRSVAHQHTHLIKTTNQRARMILQSQKPYLLFKI